MEKRGLSKRSQSEVITTVLIILLVIVAVFIVYVAVRNIIKSGTAQAGASSSKFDVALTVLKPCFVNGANYIPVSRKAGAGNISEIRILFKNSGGATVCTYSNKTNIPKELEAVIYNVSLTGACSGAAAYEVYPIIIFNGKEVIGMKAIEIGSGCAGGVNPGTVPGTGCSDCISDWTGIPFCNVSDGNLYQSYVTRSCVGGTTCTGVTSSRLNLSCNGNGCAGAACKSAPAGCTNGATRLCSKQFGVCSGAQETCTGGVWPGCDASTYLAHNSAYQDKWESTCNGGQDNDCDGYVDCADCDCFDAGGAQGHNCADCSGGSICGDGVCNVHEACALDCSTEISMTYSGYGCWDNADNDQDGYMNTDDCDCFEITGGAYLCSGGK